MASLQSLDGADHGDGGPNGALYDDHEALLPTAMVVSDAVGREHAAPVSASTEMVQKPQEKDLTVNAATTAAIQSSNEMLDTVEPRHSMAEPSPADALMPTVGAATTEPVIVVDGSGSGSEASGGGAAVGVASSPTGNVSAVYRWYDIEATLSLKRREESSIARCKLCRVEGKVERKSSVRFSKSVTSNLWRHLKENHPEVYAKHAGEKKKIPMHKLVNAKKRNRKKSTGGEAATSGGSSTIESLPSQSGLRTPTAEGEEHTRFLESTGEANGSGGRPREGQEEDEDSDGSGLAARKPAKKARHRRASDAFFHEYALMMATNGNIEAEKRAAPIVNLDKVREGAAFMCLHEMVPLELCSTLSFRNLLSECQASSTLMDDANALAGVFGKQAIMMQTTKLVRDVKERVFTQLRSIDGGVHTMIVEWDGESRRERRSGDVAALPRVIGIFAVGLDSEFNLVRRCLHTAFENTSVVQGQLDNDPVCNSLLGSAMATLTRHRFAPSLAVVEPRRRKYYATACASHKVEILESITSLLRDIMLATITETSFSDHFVVGSENASEELSLGAFDHSFDSEMGVHASEYGDREEENGDNNDAANSESEVPTSILLDLPNVLTGHTIRDILFKVLHFTAHIKQSKLTRAKMMKIMVDEFRMDSSVCTEGFVQGLRSLSVSIHSIYEVLTLTLKMMPTWQRYFEFHRDGGSDFSKLVQLASLSSYEWGRVGYLTSLLKPFADATTKLRSQKFVVSSLIVPSVYTLLERMRHNPTSTDVRYATGELPEDIVALKNVAFAKLSSCFGYLFATPDDGWSDHQLTTFNWLWSATLLDPRTRSFIIKGPLTQHQLWHLVKTEAATISGSNEKNGDESASSKNANVSIGLNDVNDATAEGISTVGDAGSKGVDLWDDLQANLASCAQEELLLSSSKTALEITKSNNLIEVEISFFQEEKHISLSENPLEWWQNMRIKFPYLARLARYVLSIPGHTQLDMNPLTTDSGLLRSVQAQLPHSEICDFLCASINLRLEKHHFLEKANRQLWTTV